MRENGGVKREATITAGVLRPRYLRTYARLAPVNRAKGARLRLDRGPGFDEEDVDNGEKRVDGKLLVGLESNIMVWKLCQVQTSGSLWRRPQVVQLEVSPRCLVPWHHVPGASCSSS